MSETTDSALIEPILQRLGNGKRSDSVRGLYHE
jgi:hypothetical protein